MKTTRRLIGCALALAAAPLCAQATPLGAKPGAWETTITSTMSGLPQTQAPKPTEEQLAQMPPERRAMIEKMMAMREGKPVTSTNRSCLKETDNLDKMMADDPNRPNCKKKILSQTSTSLEMEITCAAPHATHAHIKMEARSSEELVSTTDVQGENGFKVHANLKSHWLGSSCADLPKR